MSSPILYLSIKFHTLSYAIRNNAIYPNISIYTIVYFLIHSVGANKMSRFRPLVIHYDALKYPALTGLHSESFKFTSGFLSLNLYQLLLVNLFFNFQQHSFR